MSQRPAVLTEEIEELRKKVTLLGGDTKAYKETSQWKIKTNKEIIQKMRQQSKEYRIQLAKSKAGDEKVIDDAFKERDPQKHCAMKGLPGRVAIEKLDQQVCESVNKLNSTRHQRKNRQKTLEQIQRQVDQMSKETEEIQKTDVGESPDAQTLRVLENRLDKMNLKCNEATRITTTYQQIIQYLKEEQLKWPNMLKDLEEAIKAQKDELRELKAMNNDAQIARDTAKSELSRLEQSVYESKREREAALAEYKREAEEKKEHAEKVEKRLQRGSLQDDLSDQKPVLSGEEQERKITTYEGAMMKIKDATGVSDIREVVQRFLSQGDTQKHLEQLKNDNEKMLVRLKEEKVAIEKLDQQVCESVNKLNSTRHQRKNRQKTLEQIQRQVDQMSKETEEIQKTDVGESPDAQTLRVLENRLDKMNLKCNEATRITTTYQQIIQYLKEEQLKWPNMLKDLEEAIKAQKDELRELKAMNNDAQIARDTAKSELSRLEQSVYESKREREAALAEYKREAEEKKEHAEKVEKRLQRGSLQDDLSDQKPVLSGEEQERKITTYEGAMMKIKDATGVSDIREVVQRFLSQGDTQKHLEQLKNDNEKMLVRLKEEKEKLQREFEDMKYSGEAKLSSGQRMLEEFQQRLQGEEKKLEESRIRQERASKTLINVKSGVEHLADKLQHLKAPKGNVPQAQLSPTSDEYVLDLLGQCEQKLLKLMDDLGGKDIEDILKEDSEFRVTMESKIPQYNTRIHLPKTRELSGTNYDDDEESGDDEDVLSRQAIKMHAQQIIDSKNKKHKPRKSKRKTK